MLQETDTSASAVIIAVKYNNASNIEDAKLSGKQERNAHDYACNNYLHSNKSKKILLTMYLDLLTEEIKFDYETNSTYPNKKSKKRYFLLTRNKVMKEVMCFYHEATNELKRC